MEAEYLQYFKDLIEGHAKEGWIPWFKKNENYLKASMSRAAFLRLKFNKIQEAIKILQSKGIKFKESPLLPKFIYLSNYNPNALDEKWEIKQDFWNKSYNGAFGLFQNDDKEGSYKKLTSYLNKAINKSPKDREVEVSDFLCDARLEYLYGNQGLGLMMLKLLSKIESHDDIILHYISEAEVLLSEIKE